MITKDSISKFGMPVQSSPHKGYLPPMRWRGETLPSMQEVYKLAHPMSTYKAKLRPERSGNRNTNH